MSNSVDIASGCIILTLPEIAFGISKYCLFDLQLKNCQLIQMRPLLVAGSLVEALLKPGKRLHWIIVIPIKIGKNPVYTPYNGRT